MNTGAISLSAIRLQQVELLVAGEWPLALDCDNSAYFIVAAEQPLQFARAQQHTVVPAGVLLIAAGGAGVSIETTHRPSPEKSVLIARVDLCEPFRFGLKGRLPSQLLVGEKCQATRQRIDDISRMIRQAESDDGIACAARISRLTELLLLEATEHYMSSSRLDAGLASALTDRRLGPALHAIHDSPDRSWTVGSLAGLASMSRSLFAARFKSVLNETPLNYVRQCRMYKARQLLEESSASVDQVARESGYASLSSFVKAFAQINGETPGRWRERQRFL